jgi:superfamily I DNA/RNA helicase
MYDYTTEQQLIFDEILSPTSPIVAIKAVAGASKTTSLVAAIKRYKQIYPDASVRYLIFGNLAAADARTEFGTNAIASTLHAYAYHYVVKEYKLGTVRPFLTWRDLPKSIKRPFNSDGLIINMIDDYCASGHLSLDSYISEQKDFNPEFDTRLVPCVKQFLNQMAQGRMPITHGFYLKLFHIFVMAGKIKLDHHERLLVDEFQDMSTLALDIIKAIPADQKIFVGDSNQAVFEFLKLTDGFSHFPEAKVLTLSKSFRVSNKYAPAIQEYLRNHLEPDAVFEGMDYPADVKPSTKAYLTRTNASLIGKMIELNKQNTPYNLSTKAKLSQMFKLPLALIYAKPGFDQKDPELKHLQHDIDDWGSLPLAKRAEMSLFSYLKQTNPNDNKLISALMLILKFDRQDIIDAYEHAKEHKGTACNLSLLTAHTSKGKF